MFSRCCGTIGWLLLVSSVSTAQYPEPQPLMGQGQEAPAGYPGAFLPVGYAPAPASNLGALVPVPGVQPAPCTTCTTCPKRAWIEGEYLMWWVQRGPLPVPVATTSGPAALGIVGVGDTRGLRGRESFEYGPVSGLRLTGGLWFDDDNRFGLRGGAFLFEHRQDGFTINSRDAGLPLLARPFFDTTTQLQNSRLIAFPGGSRGQLDVVSGSRLWGAEVGGVYNPSEPGGVRVMYLGGFRYLDLAEDVEAFDSSNLFSPLVTTTFNQRGAMGPATTSIADRIATRNQFYGGQVGALVGYTHGAFDLDVTGKVALGSMHQVVSRDGMSSLTGAGTVPGGFFVLASNRGRMARNHFAVVPEVNVKLSLRLCEYAKVTLGYSYLFVSDTVRPGDQLDAQLNPTLLPLSPTFGQTGGTARPAPLFNRGTFSAHGFNVGLNLSY